MTVYRVDVETAWYSPGNSAGDPPGWCAPTVKTWFVETETPEEAITVVRCWKGTQDSRFVILRVELMSGNCQAMSRRECQRELSRIRSLEEAAA